MTTCKEWIDLAREELGALRSEELAEAGILFPDNQYAPVVCYPPITMYPPASAEAIFDRDENPFNTPTYSAYVHIPFCLRRCVFCHWVFTVGASDNDVDDYLDTLSMEMRLVKQRLGMERIPTSTAIFGGGTPTYLKPRQLERVLNDFTGHFDLSCCRQFSVEAEPSSLLGEEGFEKLKIMKDYGVHRVSLGVQSFNDDILKTMTRPHDAAQALSAIQQIRKAGIDSISIDLIYGYPGLKVEDWIETMKSAVKSGADAWQLYRLRIERYGDVQGAIMRQHRKMTDRFPTRGEIDLMKMLGNIISEKNGYAQHFSRIFASHRRHISEFLMDFCCYLSNVVGMGPSAWSNYHRTFTQNVGKDIKLYRRLVREGKIPIDRGFYRDLDTEARRSLITPLKNDRLHKKHFLERTGLSAEDHFASELQRLKRYGLIEEDERCISLTRRGRFYADQTVLQLFQREYMPIQRMPHSLTPD
jgi:oxygen-independent coproporphyrinogen III oxidase